MGNSLEGRVALVTGGTRGIGRGIAEGFLSEGASVMMSSRSEAKGAQALAEVDAGDRADFVSCDARDRESVNAMVDATVARFGRVDILVNNAGGSDGFAPVHLMTDEAWDNALSLGINTAFWATRRALASMVEHGWGRIINISSVEGKLGNKHGRQPLRHRQARHQRLHQGGRRRVRHAGHHVQRDPARAPSRRT